MPTTVGLLGVPSVHLSDVAAGTGGFVIQGAKDYDQSGVSVRSAGDIDGDGFDDIIIGAHFVNVIDAIDQTELVTAGAGYVIYGKAGGFGAPLDLGAIATGNREHGFVIDGMDPGDFTGWSVASAGDVNGDGFDDMLLGAPNGDAEDNTRPGAGDSYIVFGTADRYAFGERIDLSDISFGLHNVGKPLRGVVLHGAVAGDRHRQQRPEDDRTRGAESFRQHQHPARGRQCRGYDRALSGGLAARRHDRRLHDIHVRPGQAGGRLGGHRP